MEHNYIHTYVDYVTSLRKDTTGLFWQVSFQPNYENYKNYKITKIVIPEIKVSAWKQSQTGLRHPSTMTLRLYMHLTKIQSQTVLKMWIIQTWRLTDQN